MNLRILAPLLATTVCGVMLAADKEKPLPKDLPPYGSDVAYVPPPILEIKLDDGLAVWMAPVAGFPKVAFAFAVRGGFAADPNDLPGASELLASTIAQGTTHRSARHIAEELQGCGGDLAAQPHKDFLTLETSVLAEKAEPALDVLTDLIRNATLPDHEVQIAKQKAAATIESEEAQPSFIARRALYHALFGNHPYAVVSATKESIEKITPADLKREYMRRFRPSHSLLIIVGDFNPKTMELAVRKKFDGWVDAPMPPVTDAPTPVPSRSNAILYAPRPNSVQTTFYVGALAPTRGDSDFHAVSLADAIYGSGFGSRLVLNIREDKGYTYSPYSSVGLFRKAGVLSTRADVRNEVTGASFNEISYELNRMATTGPEPEEVERSKRFVVGSLAVSLQPQSGLAGELAEYWADSLTPKDLADESQKLLNVSAKQIEEVSRKYFSMSRMTVVAVGDENVIRTQLAPFGLEFQKVR